jgi:1-deoxy-D-xylulose-5-phosphate reductoisomerase
MPEIIEKAMQKVTFIEKPSLDDLIQTNAEARKRTIFLTEN